MSENGKMQRPTFKYEINLNTIITLVGFGMIVFGWGWSASNLSNAQRQDRVDIDGLKTSVASLQTVTETNKQDIAGLKQRTNWLENGASATATALHEQEKAIAGIASDVRVTREIVQRLDDKRRGPTSQP